MVSRLSEVGWLSALIAVPLIVDPTHPNAFIVPKMMALAGCAIFVALGILLSGRIDARNFIAMFGIAYGLATVFSVNPALSFWGSGERGRGLVTIGACVLIAVAIRGSLDEQVRSRILIAMLLGTILTCLWALYAQTTLPWGTRVSGTIGNPIFLASYLIVPTFLAAGYASKGPKGWPLYLLFLAVVALCGTRTACIAIAAGLLSWRRVATSVFVVGIVVVAITFAVNMQRRGTEHAELRMQEWAASSRALGNISAWRWVVGNGPENYSPEGGILGESAHNVYIQLLYTTGILGLGSWLAMFGFAWKNSEPWARAALLAVSVDAIAGIMSIAALVVIFTTIALAGAKQGQTL